MRIRYLRPEIKTFLDNTDIPKKCVPQYLLDADLVHKVKVPTEGHTDDPSGDPIIERMLDNDPKCFENLNSTKSFYRRKQIVVNDIGYAFDIYDAKEHNQYLKYIWHQLIADRYEFLFIQADGSLNPEPVTDLSQLQENLKYISLKSEKDIIDLMAKEGKERKEYLILDFYKLQSITRFIKSQLKKASNIKSTALGDADGEVEVCQQHFYFSYHKSFGFLITPTMKIFKLASFYHIPKQKWTLVFEQLDKADDIYVKTGILPLTLMAEFFKGFKKATLQLLPTYTTIQYTPIEVYTDFQKLLKSKTLRKIVKLASLAKVDKADIPAIFIT